MLLCLVVCLTLLASFFLPSYLSLKHIYIEFYEENTACTGCIICYLHVQVVLYVTCMYMLYYMLPACTGCIICYLSRSMLGSFLPPNKNDIIAILYM